MLKRISTMEIRGWLELAAEIRAFREKIKAIVEDGKADRDAARRFRVML